jgi:hypothetical protein
MSESEVMGWSMVVGGEVAAWLSKPTMVEPEHGGQGEQSLRGADPDPSDGSATVLLEAELALEGVNDPRCASGWHPGCHPLWHRPGVSGVVVVKSRPEAPGAVATPLAMPRSRGGPEEWRRRHRPLDPHHQEFA